LIKLYNRVVYHPISWNAGDKLSNPDRFILALDKIKSKLLHDKFTSESLKEVLVDCEILDNDDNIVD
jgi:hypothetical protein